MSHPESISRAGKAVPPVERKSTSPAQSVTQALAGFVQDFKGLQSEIETKLQKQEERLTMLDRKTMTNANRPVLSGAVATGAPHQNRHYRGRAIRTSSCERAF